jgi:Ca-activated chloride channel homolog
MRNRFSCWTVLTMTGVLGCSGAESASDSAAAMGSAGAAAPPQAQQDAAAPAANSGTMIAWMRPAAPSSGTNGAASTATTPTASGAAPSTGASAAAGAGAAASAGTPTTPGATPPPTQEKFDDVGSNPFVVAERDPFSTFAADVDTASYDVFRRNTEYKTAVTQESVRIEEFVNYFEYAYEPPAADAEHPFRIHTAFAQNPFGRDTVLARVGIQARMPKAEDRKQANLVFLVDTSGSMQAEDKLPLVKYLLTQTLEVLNPDDKVSIVTYSGTTMVALEPTQIVEKDKIRVAAESLVAAGGTNGAGGIQLAYEQADNAFLQDGINHVILCTDGDFNIGISNTEELVALIEKKRESGVTLTALGFGIGNLNDAMMEKVSNAGNGMYSVITSRTQASRYAEDRMLRTFLHVAKDMKIQLEWNPDVVEAYRLIGYEDRAIADMDFRDDKVDAGEVGAGHRVTALYEIVPKGKPIPKIDGAPVDKTAEKDPGERELDTDDMLLVKVRYKQPGAAESDAAKEVVERAAGSDIVAFSDADQDLQYSAAIAAFAEILKHSPYATPDKLDQLREVFAAQQERDVERKEFLALFDTAVSFLPKP